MTRVKRGNVARQKHNKILKLNKGFRGSASKLFRTANQKTFKSLKYSYQNRLKKKRDFRSLWITRLNSFIKFYNDVNKRSSYSQFISNLKKNSIKLNRKILSQLSIYDKKFFPELFFIIK